MNDRTFDRKATAGVTGYLTRHELEPNDLRIKTMRFGRREHFRFYHRGELVADVAGRPAMLRWMRESTKEEALAAERASSEKRRRDVIRQEACW